VQGNRVVETGADIGIALDGDADRLIVVDEKGQTVDGDQIMALIGSQLAARGRLQGGGVVATVMSNLGSNAILAGQGLTLERTKVGDRHVLEAMKAGGFNVGGEQSGHMILLDHAPPAMAPLPRCRCWRRWCNRASGPASCCTCSIRCRNCSRTCAFPAASRWTMRVKAVIADAEASLAGKGRLVIRPSGTEPVIRVMAEGDDAARSRRRRCDLRCGEGRRPDAGNAPRLRTLRQDLAGRSARRVHLFVRMHLLRECADALDDRCPNCGGELMDRPSRAAKHHAKHPPSTERKYKG
jgi:hypothetical protein